MHSFAAPFYHWTPTFHNLVGADVMLGVCLTSAEVAQVEAFDG